MCGFVGIVGGPGAQVAAEIHVGLQAVQHRGQDSAGLATMNADGTRFMLRRGLGTAVQALTEIDLAVLTGPIGIGHVRYPTIGAGTVDDAQPCFYRQPGILMAHNGNLTNYDEVRRSLAERSIHLLTHCDVEPALCELADGIMAERRSHHRVEDAVRAARVMTERIAGAYSIVAALMLDGVPTLMVVRDRYGIRPAVVGRRRDGAWIAASESVALDALGFELLADPVPGEVMFLRAGQDPVRHRLSDSAPAPCIFEQVYFARPDSVMAGRSVYEVRLGFGRALAERIAGKKLVADVVVPVPDTSRPAAAMIAEVLRLPHREGFIKNRYSGRTFIMPDQLTRNAALRLKLNPLRGVIVGQRVLLVDDSIVRGTTLRKVITLLRDSGAKEVHLAIHSPPVRHPCFYGIDMSTEEELFARKFDGSLDELEKNAAHALGADTLTYLPIEAMDGVFGGPRCAACFDGSYPEPVDAKARSAIEADRRKHAKP